MRQQPTGGPGGNAGAVDVTDAAAVAAFEQLVRLSAGLADAEARARKRRDDLDAAIAAHVTTKPESATWYAHPGTLTIDQAIAAVGGGPTGIHRAMERHRKAHPSKPRRGGRR